MVVAADIADWWDKQKKESEKALEDWVDENPQWWTVVVATAVQTSMDLGQGFVDALRFGQGVAEGGWRGYGKDFLRLLTLLGPLGKVGGMASRFGNLNALKLAVKTEGVTGPCTFTAANDAMSIVSRNAKNLFLTAKEAAKALGKPLSQLARVGSKYKLAAWIDELIPFLRSQGVKIRTLSKIGSLEDVATAAKTQNGVVVFAIKYTTMAGRVIRHTVIAVADGFGRVRYADYGGRICTSLEELAMNLKLGAPDAQGIKLFTRPSSPGAVIFDGPEFTQLMDDAKKVFEGAVLVIEGFTAIETNEHGVDLAMPIVIAAAPVKEIRPEVLKESFDAFKARRAGKPVVRMPEVKIVGNVPRADWLTGIQYRLNHAGFGAGPVDGILGPRTKKALKMFQETYQGVHRLMVDGIPGPQTQEALVSVCGY